MAKPIVHAMSSVKRFGGTPDDYLPLHCFLYSSKAAIADNRHRALTHNAWFIGFVLPKVFGETFVNSDGRTVSTRDVAEQHVLEDFGGRFIPSAQDYLAEVEMKDWMQNGGGTPPSYARLASRRKVRVVD